MYRRFPTIVVILCSPISVAAQNVAQDGQLEQQVREAQEAAVVAVEAAEMATEERERLEELREAFQSDRPQTDAEILASFENVVDIYDGRAYKRKGEDFPWELKCSSVDYRMFHGCLELRFFDPSARVYFDRGTDDPGEVDVFSDGNLNVTVDLASLYFPWRLGRSEFYDSWSWGPVVGAGISSAASDSEDGSVEASGAPVVLFSLGGMLEYKLDSGAAFAFETGYSIGFSSDESFGDTDDTALYVGIRINVPIGSKEPPKAPKVPESSP